MCLYQYYADGIHNAKCIRSPVNQLDCCAISDPHDVVIFRFSHGLVKDFGVGHINNHFGTKYHKLMKLSPPGCKVSQPETNHSPHVNVVVITTNTRCPLFPNCIQDNNVWMGLAGVTDKSHGAQNTKHREWENYEHPPSIQDDATSARFSQTTRWCRAHMTGDSVQTFRRSSGHVGFDSSDRFGK